MLLRESIEAYLNDCYGLAKGTQNLYAYHLGHLSQVFGGQPVSALTSAVIRTYLASLKRQNGQEYSPAYLHQVCRTLNTFFEWCTREKLLPQNPLDQVRRPRVPRRKSPRLSLEEIGRLLDAVAQTAQPERNLALVCLMLDSGLRRAETLGLRLQDVDLEHGTARVLGKGGKERDVPIGAVTCQAISSYLAVRPLSEDDTLFVTQEGTSLTRCGLGTLMHRLKKRAGLPQLRCHLLRHTFANHFIANGGGLRQLQKILGHASITTTADIYLDPELRELQREHARCSPLVKLGI